MSRITKLGRKGRLPRLKMIRCPSCRGSGIVEKSVTAGGHFMSMYASCGKCHGNGTLVLRGRMFRLLKRRR